MRYASGISLPPVQKLVAPLIYRVPQLFLFGLLQPFATARFPAYLYWGCLFAAFLISIAKRSTIIAGLPNRKQKHIPISKTDELKKYKKLLDAGVITQEEFNTRKQQLLDL